MENTCLERKINSILLEKSITPRLKGFHYIKTALISIVKNNDYFVPIMQLYEEIAIKYNTTVHSVERAIRHAIKRAIRHSITRSGKDPHVNNSCFIFTIADGLHNDD